MIILVLQDWLNDYVYSPAAVKGFKTIYDRLRYFSNIFDTYGFKKNNKSIIFYLKVMAQTYNQLITNLTYYLLVINIYL